MGDESLLSEVKNADWQFEVGRTYVLGPELFDQKISANELRLLLVLRYRASGGDNNFVSHKTLAKDMKAHEKTVSKWMSKLKNLGYITCRERGYAKSNIKTITSMVERYDKDLLLAPKKEVLGMGRTEEMLAKLHNLDKAPDDPIVTQGLPKDIDNAKQVQLESYGYSIGNPTVTPLVTEGLRHKVDKEEVDESEVDSPRAARRPTQPEAESDPKVGLGFQDGTPYDLETGEIIKPKDYHPGALAPDSGKSKKGKTGQAERGSLSEIDRDEALRIAREQIVPSAGSSAHRLAKEAIGKADERKARQEASGEAEKVREWKKATKAQRATIKAQLEEFMMDTFRDWFPDARMGKFGGPEYGKLNHLLRIYDNDAVFIRKAWKSLCSDWEEIQKRLKIKDSVPTVGIFLGFRESIFAIVQEVKTTRQEQESKDLSGKYEW